MSRDEVGRIVQSPWWVVVGVVLSGGVYATRLAGQMEEMQAQVVPLREIRRELDSLRIEQRHMNQAIDEIRHLLGRMQ